MRTQRQQSANGDTHPGPCEHQRTQALALLKRRGMTRLAEFSQAGITATTVELAAPLIANGDLVRVLSPWITDRLTLYAALPSRKFMPRRTEVFLDYLTEQTRERVGLALAQCTSC